MSSKFKQLSAEQRKTPPRVGIPQVDPGETGKVVLDQSVQAPATPAPGPEQPPKAPAETEVAPSSLPAAVDPRMLKVKRGETPIKMGWHMYPTRHRQVVYEAFMLGVKPWEVNETALAEYFERRYGKPSSSK
jgi:hypothetical protein